jgi:hypothetical protein
MAAPGVGRQTVALVVDAPAGDALSLASAKRPLDRKIGGPFTQLSLCRVQAPLADPVYPATATLNAAVTPSGLSRPHLGDRCRAAPKARDGPPVGEEGHPAGRRLGGLPEDEARNGSPGPPHRGTVNCVA